MDIGLMACSREERLPDTLELKELPMMEMSYNKAMFGKAS